MRSQKGGYCRKVTLTSAGPCRLELTVWALRRRANNKIDTWRDSCYRRLLVIENQEVLASVCQNGPVNETKLKCELSSHAPITPKVQKRAKELLTSMLGLDVDLSGFYALARNDRMLKSLVGPYKGFKPPRFTNVFEAIINGICFQQLSIVVGTILLNRLAVATGRELAAHDDMFFSCPEPERVAAQSFASLRKLGFSGSKANALLEMSKSIVQRKIQIDDIAKLDDESAINLLLGFRGLGRWTARYVLLRGLGRLHIYPGDDIGFQNGLKKWLGLDGISKKQVEEIMQRWQGYGGMIYFHILLRRLTSEGLIND